MIQEFIKSLFLIFMAEMGDKTQILALAFATQFTIKEVLAGVFLGSFLNHGIAVILGTYLSTLIPIKAIQIIAGFSFIGFSLWTLKSDDEEDKEETKKKFGPILTVGLAFFIGELGDKTQLAAITLAVDANYPAFILLGTVTGMILTSGIGIYIGSKIGNKIPEILIKLVSSSIFMIFGLLKLYNSLSNTYLTPTYVTTFIIVIGILVYLLVKNTLKIHKEKATPLQEAALSLYEYTHKIKDSVDDICLQCNKCKKDKCYIGYIKGILKKSLEDENYKPDIKRKFPTDKLDYNKEEISKSLALVINFLVNNPNNNRVKVIKEVRHILERILFNEEFNFKNKESYFKTIKSKNESIAEKIILYYNEEHTYKENNRV